MKKIMTCLAALTLPAIVLAQAEPDGAPSPNQIVDEAPAAEWISIPADDLLVMRLAPDNDGNPREVIIQLMPPPFSQGWVHNIKLLAREGWYDGISVNRVQDNYVVQWGDPNYDNPESDGEAKPLPEGLKVMSEDEYLADYTITYRMPRSRPTEVVMDPPFVGIKSDQTYGDAGFSRGWPVGIIGGRKMKSIEFKNPVLGKLYPVHCYGMVGVGRNYSPDTGSGAELYTVIGHAPRHLDRNIALVGRIIEGMEHLSSLPRGNGVLGFYAEDEEGKRTPILSIDVAADLLESDEEPAGLTYAYEYLSTESETFAKYADARANRRDPFFIHPAGGADICNVPVPIRPAPNG
jgi:peptidylprolyl isomerase